MMFICLQHFYHPENTQTPTHNNSIYVNYIKTTKKNKISMKNQFEEKERIYYNYRKFDVFPLPHNFLSPFMVFLYTYSIFKKDEERKVDHKPHRETDDPTLFVMFFKKMFVF